MRKLILLLFFVFANFNFNLKAQFLYGEVSYTRNSMLNLSEKFRGKPMSGYQLGLGYLYGDEDLFGSWAIYYNGFIEKTDSTEIIALNTFMSETDRIAVFVRTNAFDIGLQNLYGITTENNPFLSLFGGYSFSFTKIEYNYTLPSGYEFFDPQPDNQNDNARGVIKQRSLCLSLMGGIRYNFNKVIASLTFGGTGNITSDNDIGFSSFPSLQLFIRTGLVIPLSKRE